ncbi:g-protein subunit alpha 2 [Moniliophthora roreri]|uniref:Uncharacterized protein n=1 Tax=Moniliophthora roreri TaxID=221103 RepID=A0A0W0F8E9_MONRR|nr:g-protein subunit alpha 2 [Moniliophthora roreri]
MLTEYSEIASTTSAATYTTSSTIVGLGSLSGKVIKRLGQAIIGRVDVMLLRRRLAHIERYFSNQNSFSAGDEGIYGDLLELSRDGYEHRFRARAFRLIMARIGSMDLDLAPSTVQIVSTLDIYLHLSEVFSCLWNKGVASDISSPPPYTPSHDNPRLNEQESTRLSDAYEAYVTAFPSHIQIDGLPRFFFYSPFLIYLAQIVSLGTREHARLVVQLGIIDFLRTLGLSEKINQVREALAPRILLYTLLSRLDPVSDSDIYSSVANYFRVLTSIAERSIQADFNGLWSWVHQQDQFDSDLVDFKMKAKISDAVEILKSFFLDRLNYAVRDEINFVSIIGQNTQLLLKDISTLPGVLQEDNINSGSASEHIVNSIVLSLLRLPASCWEYGKGKPTETLEQILLSKTTYDHRLNWITWALHECGYNASSLQSRYTSAPGSTDANAEYFLDILARTAELEAGRLEVAFPSAESISRSYAMTRSIHEVTLAFDGKKYRVHPVGGRKLADSQLQAQGGMQPTIVVVASLGTSFHSLKEHLSSFNNIKKTLPVNVPIVLLLTEKSLLRQKVQMFRDNFPDYDGGNDIDSACYYFERLFAERSNRAIDLGLYVYTTMHAVDAEEIREIFQDVHRKICVSREDAPQQIDDLS